MVDLHQSEPGLPDGHPWLALSRWGMAWRTLLSCIAVGLLGELAFGLVTAGPAGLIATGIPGLGVLYGVIAPVLFALLAIAAGPWLRRCYPFSQSLLFAGLGIIGIGSLAFIWLLADSIGYRCEPHTYCSPPIASFVWFVFILAGPLFLQGCVAYGLAIWGCTRRGRRVFWPVLAGSLVLFAAIGAVAWSRIDSYA